MFVVVVVVMTGGNAVGAAAAAAVAGSSFELAVAATWAHAASLGGSSTVASPCPFVVVETSPWMGGSLAGTGYEFPSVVVAVVVIDAVSAGAAAVGGVGQRRVDVAAAEGYHYTPCTTRVVQTYHCDSASHYYIHQGEGSNWKQRSFPSLGAREISSQSRCGTSHRGTAAGLAADNTYTPSPYHPYP